MKNASWISIYLSKTFQILVASFVLFFLIFSITSPAFAGSADNVCDGLVSVTGESCNKTTSTSEINNALAIAMNMLSLVAGILSVIMIIIGGLKFMSSQGDSQKVNQARNNLIYAAVGIVIIAIAQVIVKFVLKKASDSVTS